MKTYSHNYGEYEIQKEMNRLYSNVESSLRDIDDVKTQRIKEEVKNIFQAWDKRGKNTEGLQLKYGYRRGNIQAETQFGNVARYYADLMKLEKAFQEGEIKYALFILPTKKRAKEVGSNIANFEKATKELKELREIIQIPMIVYGI